MRRGGYRLSIAIGAFVASMALTASAGAHHGVPEEDGVAPGEARPGDRTFGKGQNKVHTIPIRRGGLLDYGRLPDGTPLLSHGPDPEPLPSRAAANTAALLAAGGPGAPQPRNHNDPLPHPPIPRPGDPVADTGFSQVDNLVDDALDQVLDALWGPDAAPPPESPIDCVAQGSANSYEVIYYIAVGKPDDFDQLLPHFRSEVKKAMRLVVDEASTTGTFYRTFKAETEVVDGSCEPRIQKINGTQSGGSFGAVTGDLSTNFGKNQGNRKYIVFVEGIAGCGQATIYRDVSKSSSNQHNTRTGYALIKPNCWDNAGRTTLHESGHNLSAVQARLSQDGSPQNNTLGPVPPYSNERWHCWDEIDVMCQIDGPPAITTQIVCADRQWFDCNHDDYFHPDPAAGNWLASHFNLANDSTFVEGTDATDPVLDADVKDVSPLTANELLYQTTGDERFAYEVELNSVGADNWGVDTFAVIRSGRRPWNLDGSCPGGVYLGGTSFTFDTVDNKRIEALGESQSWGIIRPGCYRFEVFATDVAGRTSLHFTENLKVSTPQDHAIEPARGALGDP